MIAPSSQDLCERVQQEGNPGSMQPSYSSASVGGCYYKWTFRMPTSSSVCACRSGECEQVSVIISGGSVREDPPDGRGVGTGNPEHENTREH